MSQNDRQFRRQQMRNVRECADKIIAWREAVEASGVPASQKIDSLCRQYAYIATVSACSVARVPVGPVRF